jgi:hypothetical protein
MKRLLIFAPAFFFISFSSYTQKDTINSNSFSQKQNKNFKNEDGFIFGNTVYANTLKYYNSPHASPILMYYYRRQIYTDSLANYFLQTGCNFIGTNAEVDNINGDIVRVVESYYDIPISFDFFSTINWYIAWEMGLGANFAILNKQQFELPPGLSLPDKYNKSNKFGDFIKAGVYWDLALRFSSGPHSKKYGKIGYMMTSDYWYVYKTKNIIPYYYKNYGLYVSFGARF